MVRLIQAVMESMLKDLRYTFRVLAKKPGWTCIILLTGALGIGANSAIFSFIQSVLLNPLPFKDTVRLVRIESRRGGESGKLSLRELEDIKQQTTLFEEIAAYIPGAQYNMSGDGTPEEIPATLATHNLPAVLGITPVRGQLWPNNYDWERSFGVLLSYELWQRRFGGDPNIVGQKITLDAAPFYTVFGVLPPQTRFPTDAHLLRSIFINSNYPGYERRESRTVFGLGRLKSGITIQQAQAELEGLSQHLTTTFPDSNTGVTLTVTPLKDLYVGNIRPYLFLLMGAVGMVLLIACSNITNLLLAQVLQRERELAIRITLGASTWQIIRQLLTESLVLGLGGGLSGLILAYWWVIWLGKVVESELPPWMVVQLDWNVVVFTIVISILTGVITGLLPAFQSADVHLNDVIKEGSQSTSASLRRNRLRRLLVIAEIALALVLLSIGGVFVQSFLNLQQTQLGFDCENLLTFRIALPWKKYDDDTTGESMIRFFQRTLQKLEAVPGVGSAAICTQLPLSGNLNDRQTRFTAQGQSLEEMLRNPYVNLLKVSPNYFDTLRIPLIRGRVFETTDTLKTAGVAVVNRRLAERLRPGGDVVGMRIKVGTPDETDDYMKWKQWLEIVGVVGDIKQDEVGGQSALALYMSYQQLMDGNMYVAVKCKVPPVTLVNPVNQAVWAIDPEQATFDIKPMDERLADMLRPQRLASSVVGLFAVVALVLAAGGLYGVMAYSVGQRTREIGIRLALGAQPLDVVHMILRETGQLILAGLLLGGMAVLVFGKMVATLLFEISPFDPLTFGVVSTILCCVMLLAGFIPARRAASTDPVQSMRVD